MSEFDLIEVRRLDLTLLVVFEEALASQKLSAVAKKLGLTQSAISHSVKRLRDIFGDELFIRTPHGILPTPRALALRAPLSEAVRLISGTIRPTTFDPAATDHVFRIAAPDYETAMFAPALARSTQDGPRFVFLNLIRDKAIAALGAAEVDIALGYTRSQPNGCDSLTLYEEDYLVVARTGHPALEGDLDLAKYAACGHVLTSLDGSLTGIVDQRLAAAGLKRRVVVGAPYFLATLATAARSDLIATVPRRLAISHADFFGLETAIPPLPIRRFSVRATWNRRLGSDQANVWLRGLLWEAAQAFASGTR